ncbi:enoyl-CoA hydratase [Oharaeibacter diazotrophicus]|uniref:enoyl-CoA hydratase n=1 Tax=Oharaeibacter diazotrophicus TaxID=1920512 RepID=A0A4R6R5N5_9HYPH|nr:enoyl-CoA hydratase [Oharaeibacter diazotrophicus]TDP80915.1 enoyl-CoA hydratase [Oharaeibacter diazotrophicus]BBE73810.1 putative enoyl-CoA hydratase echA8 [Pleomorphomonas sp. SM30]GLS74706.1 enoyl-CoA hydratase [Oharaeibacter diazotrophicus]
MSYETITSEMHGAVLLVRIDRPKVLNALNTTVMRELVDRFAAADRDPAVRAIVLTGSGKAFAAGADISEMAGMGFPDIYGADTFGGWDRFAATRKPVIAAVGGYALGGGCEVVMMCDIVLAADTAKFGQPEIKLGILPGMGGTQRLTRLVGRAKAMDLVLTGRLMDAAEAERAGLVSRIVPADRLLDEALATAATIAGYSQPATLMAKEAVQRAEEVSLSEGVRFERRLFGSLFATRDQKEGMAAFVEKRKPSFEDR